MFKFIKRFPELIFFGILTAVFSSPGQTFLVSLFIPSMRESIGISQTQIAGLYSAATLLSGLILPRIGTWLDRFHLLRFTVTAGCLLAAGCFALNRAENVFILFLGFFLVRNLGQGTLTMISATTMARIFGKTRGKAIGLSNLGYPIGEILFPGTLSFCILKFGWRSAWMLLTLLVIFVFIPLTVFLLRKDPHKKAQKQIESEIEHRAEDLKAGLTGGWTVREMLKDRRFYYLMAAVLIPSTFFTALFFHQVHLMNWKGWGLEWIAIGFVVYGVCRAAVSFLIGPAIDRWTAAKVFPYNLMPICAGLLCFAFGNHPVWSVFYLAAAGITMGLSMTISSALFAELYGTRELGAIRGITSSWVVLGTAAAPVLLGAILDTGGNPAFIFVGMTGLTILGIVSAFRGCRTSASAE